LNRQKLLNRVEALETVTKRKGNILYVTILAPMNWTDIIAVTITGNNRSRFIHHVYKDGTKHIAQQVGNKLSKEDEDKAKEYLNGLFNVALKEFESERSTKEC